jgi:hypothetical protein
MNIGIAATTFIAGLAVGGWGAWEIADKATLTSALEAAGREKAALRGQLRQNAVATAVALSAAQDNQARADEYDALRDALINGDNDAPIPVWFCEHINGLLGSGTCDPNGDGGAVGAN